MDELVFEILRLPNSKKEKQIKIILKTLSKSQKYKIQRSVRNILNGRKTLTDAQYRKLSKHKNFLRNIACGQFSRYNILKNYNAFTVILNLILEQKRNESNAKKYY